MANNGRSRCPSTIYRFLAGLLTPLRSPDKREVGSSTLPRPIYERCKDLTALRRLRFWALLSVPTVRWRRALPAPFAAPPRPVADTQQRPFNFKSVDLKALTRPRHVSILVTSKPSGEIRAFTRQTNAICPVFYSR